MSEQNNKPACAQIRYRRPERDCPDFGPWHELSLKRYDPKRTSYIDSTGWECETRLLFEHPPEAERQTLLELQHELAILHDAFKLYPGAWCCKTARSTNGWNHNHDCKNHVVCL